MAIETVSLNRSHGGVQGVYKHASRETGASGLPTADRQWWDIGSPMVEAIITRSLPSSIPTMRFEVQTDCRSIGRLFRHFVGNVPDSLARSSAQDRPGQTPVFSPHRRDRHQMAYPRRRVATSLLPSPNHQLSRWPRCRSRVAVLAPVPRPSQYRLPLCLVCVAFYSSEPLFVSFKVETTIDRGGRQFRLFRLHRRQWPNARFGAMFRLTNASPEIPLKGKHLLYGFLTTEPNDVVGPIHPKAMPVILTDAAECDTWLSAPWEEASKLPRPAGWCPEHRGQRRTRTQRQGVIRLPTGDGRTTDAALANPLR